MLTYECARRLSLVHLLVNDCSLPHFILLSVQNKSINLVKISKNGGAKKKVIQVCLSSVRACFDATFAAF